MGGEGSQQRLHNQGAVHKLCNVFYPFNPPLWRCNALSHLYHSIKVLCNTPAADLGGGVGGVRPRPFEMETYKID